MALEQNDDRSPDQGAGLPSSADRPDSPDQVTNTALEALRVAAAAARQRYEEIAQGVGVQPPDRDHRVAAAPEAGPAAVQGLDDRNEQRLDKALAAQSEALRQAAAARQRYEETWQAKQALEARFADTLRHVHQSIADLRRQRDELAGQLDGQLGAARLEQNEADSLRQALASAQAAEAERSRRRMDEQEAYDPGLAARTAATVSALARLAMRPGLFDQAYYLERNPDVAAAGLDPAGHFIAHGWKEGRTPHALAAHFREGDTGEAVDIQAPRRLFDQDFYLAHNPDLVGAPVDPYRHYCEHGWREGRDPNPLFSTARYLRANPDVGLAGVSPLLHYTLVGWREGRDIGGLFDAPFYAASCPEAAQAGINPLEHFVFHGLAEGRRPNPVLDPATFLTEAEIKQEPWAGVRLFLERLQTLAQTLKPVPLPRTDTPRFSVIVRARDNLGAVLTCLESLMPVLEAGSGEVLLADAGSRDLLPLVAPDWDGVHYLRRPRQESWQATVGAAARQARGQILVLVDAGVRLAPDWDKAVLEALERPGVGAVAGQVRDVSGTLQDAGGLLWNDASLTVRGLGQDPDHPRYAYLRPVDVPGPDLLAVPAELFWRQGGLDPGYSCPRAALADFGLKLSRDAATVLYHPFFRGVRFADPDPDRPGPADRERLSGRFAAALAALPAPDDREALHLRGVVGHVLCIDQTYPVPDQDAGSLRQYQTLKILLALGWAVTFVPEVTMAAQEPYSTDLQRLGVQCVHRPHYQNLYEFVRDEGRSVDVAMLYKGPNSAHYRRIIEPHCPGAKYVLDTVDVHYLRELRQAELSGDPADMERALRDKEIELGVIAQSDCSVVLSSYEETLVRQELPDARLSRSSLIMDCPGLQVPPEALRDICFIGGFRHQPNGMAVHFFIRDIWPLIWPRLPGVRFRIMGSHPPPDILALACQDVLVDGFVPDLATSLARCRVSVVPLLYGAGVKGKIGSSLSFGVPCVSTPIGVEGMNIGSGEGVEVAEDPADFAEKVVRLYSDQAHWNRMSAGGMRFVDREFSLRAGLSRMAQMLTELDLPVAPGVLV
ncbi:MAG: glycosyltransferase [Desulfovibrionaceae bacterium]